MTVLIIMFYSQTLHLKYAQHLQPFLQEWDTDMQKLQEQEEKLANVSRGTENSLTSSNCSEPEMAKSYKHT